MMVRSNHIFVSCSVEGWHGQLVKNPNQIIKCRVRSKVVGTVMQVVDLHKWEVALDYDGKAKVVRLNSLKVVEECTGVPLDELNTNDIDSAAAIDVSEESAENATETPTREAISGDPAPLDAVEEAEDIEPEEEITIEEAEKNEDAAPNNDFCYANDGFIEHRTSINDATKNQGKHREVWTKIKSIEG